MTKPPVQVGIVLLIGPVGAGKSTYARRRTADGAAIFFDLDRWMVRLFGADQRPAEGRVGWYLERRDRCRGLMWDTALDMVRAGKTVYLELGLTTAAEREHYYAQCTADEVPFGVYLLDAPREVRQQRVEQRNTAAQPYTQVIPRALFELASDLWQPPTELERRTWGIVDV
jgi:predicted kinase